MAKSFQKLTRPAMRSLTSGQKINEHGITFERLANGDGLFTVNVMVDRQRIHRSIGRESEGVTRTTAEEFISKVRQDAREGRLNLPKRRKVPLILKATVPLYLSRLTDEGGKDLKEKKRRLEQHVVPYLGDKPLSLIASFDIERYKKYRLSQPIQTRKKMAEGETPPLTKPATINRELAALSHLLNKALEWNWIDRTAVRIRKLKEGHGRIDFLSIEDAAKLLEAAKHDSNPQIYPFILVGLHTGMRKSEILSIRRLDIDLPNHIINIPKAKAGARQQPISEAVAVLLRGMLENLPPGTPWLFPSLASRSGHTQDVRKAFVRCVIAAGLDPKRVVRHTLRHTAITHLVQAGVDLPTVKRISGHKTLAMVERYAHQHGAHIQGAMDQLQSRYSRKENNS
jgi:integrase